MTRVRDMAVTLQFDCEAFDEFLHGYLAALALVDRLDPATAAFVRGQAMQDIEEHIGRFVSVEVGDP